MTHLDEQGAMQTRETMISDLSALPSSPVSDLVEEWRTAMEGVTPGPWTLIPAREYDGDDDDLIGSYTSPASIEGGDGNPVCTFGSEDGSGTLFENEANHRYVQRCSPDGINALLTTLSTRNAELEREVERLREAQQWQPIETAPKDDLVDIWIDHGDGTGVRRCDCYYDRICDEWRTSRPSGRLLTIKARHVTHWMSPPALSTSPQGGEHGQR